MLAARFAFCLLVVAGLAAPASAAPAGTVAVDFARQVRPILSDHCFACHGPDRAQRKAKLRLDLKEEALASGVIVPGKSAESTLIERITSEDPHRRMPPPKTGKRLGPEQIALLRQWIDAGAPWAEHWAFLRPRRTGVPGVRRADWPRNEIDFFVLARLEKLGLAPSPEADRAMLVRRLSLDLTGLPPSLAEIDDFVADRAPNAYERLVDRLLATPHRGEKMALDWLDLARFGDSNGYQDDATRPSWPYRDQVIAAFNANQPFDQFTIEQLAGDLLPGATLAQRVASGFNRQHRQNEEGGSDPEEFRVVYTVDRANTTATVWMGLTLGCAQCHDHKYDPISQQEYYRFYAFFNSLKGEVPINKNTSVNPPQLRVPSPAQQAQLRQLDAEVLAAEGRLRSDEARLAAALGRWLATRPREASLALAAPGAAGGATAGMIARRSAAAIAQVLSLPAAKRSEQDRERLRRNFAAADPERLRLESALATARTKRAAFEKKLPQTLVWEEMNTPRPAFILKRGDFQHPAEQVERGVPSILPPLSPPRAYAPASPTRPTRLDLARWLVAPEHPLTARVTVNRLWKQFFGAGLVRTPEDFGSQGESPTHPELLDWLAVRIMDHGWDIKKFQKCIVCSATYRQSSRVTPQLLALDPQNRLLARGSRFRQAAEEVRDMALAVSGLLVRRPSGPSVYPYQPAGFYNDKSKDWSWPDIAGPDLYRRGLYTFLRRTTPYPSLVTFDAPARGECIVNRPRTNTPLQALVTLNDPAFVEAARVLGQRILQEGGADTQARLTFAFRTVLSRPAQTAELSVLRKLYDERLARYQSDCKAAGALVSQGKFPRPAELDVAELAAWTAVANTLLNLDEAITRE